MAREGDYEIRRRISEALPALFRWDLQKSKEIAKILRHDWDQRWKSDIRRRVVEAVPILLNKDPEFAKSLLGIHKKDEVFTLMAITEVVFDWLKYNKAEANKFLEKFRLTVQRNYSLKEYESITKLIELLRLIEKDKFNAYKSIRELCKSKNVYVRIAVARNLYRIFDNLPEECLSMMEYFLRPDEDKNVRRPIAKETSTKTILTALKYPQYKEKAKSVLWRLVKDSDDIIRITAFDLMDEVKEIDLELCREIVNYVITNENNPHLLRRAKRIQDELYRLV